ncbi:serine hydrolase domain-containing protein [Sphingomonas sp.]|uniref:serine hydrolase domain-containing protein n=1 Tax=Sphingomonas sp. TaxID=28214 RepID=UPI003D6D7251
MSHMMRLIVALTASLGLACIAPANAETAKPAASLNAALNDVRTMVETAPGELGLVVAVTDRDRLLLVATHGYADIGRRLPVTAETRFAIGSISKSFTAIVLMQLADEGRFDPAAPIARYLPDFHLKTRFPAITGHALMTHTAGLPNYLTDVASMRFLIAALNGFEPRYVPGAHFWYSNSGYQLLGYAAERIEHRPFPLMLEERVLDRLGMSATAPQIDDRLRGQIATSYERQIDGSYTEAAWFDYLAADGAIVSTAADMSAYARMLLGRGATPAGRLISARAFDRFSTPALDNYAYGIEVSDHGQVLEHGGSIAGFQAHIEAHLPDGFAVVLLSNGPLDNALRKRIVARLTRAARGDQAPVEPVSVAPKPRVDTTSFAGRFVGQKQETLVFSATPAGGLTLDQAGAAVPLTRLGRDIWGLYLTPTGPRAFTFFRDAAGAVTDVVEGASGYAKQGSGHTLVAAPVVYQPLVGRYKAHGEEGQGVRILVRNGRLMMAYIGSNGTQQLDEAGPGRFRLADPAFAPEWFGFDTLIDGQTQRLMTTGVPLYRIDLP